MSSRQSDNIEALSEQLGSLQIAYKVSTNDEQTNTEMSTVLALAPIAVTVIRQECGQTLARVRVSQTKIDSNY